MFGTGRDRAVMDTSVTQCRVRQCSSCLGETEFFCIPCLCDLCLECKENHANNLNTFDHNVVIFCEKFKYISKKNDAKKTPTENMKLTIQMRNPPTALITQSMTMC